KKEREEQIAAITKSLGRLEGEKVRAMLEQSERDVTAKLRESAPRDRAQVQVEAGARSPIEEWREMLAALSPAERREPAWIDANQGVQFLRPYPKDMRARRLVSANPAFYRRGGGSPVAARGILVQFEGSGKSRDLMKEIRRQFDWAALAELVDPPPTMP
ncbi:MAG TPA: hypothetical protein VFV33_16565, partial [Gemmatimonadaceae bacterium]|nr:hypothetical protein [Gemmatimonadaceae bacterium]